MQESGVLGGLGGPEIIILLVWAIPAFVAWKFYQALSGINENLAGIRRTLESSTFRGNGK